MHHTYAEHLCVICVLCDVQVAEGYKQVAQLLDHLNVDASNPLAVLTQVRQIHPGQNCNAGLLRTKSNAHVVQPVWVTEGRAHWLGCTERHSSHACIL
jgi:hypothetical protein